MVLACVTALVAPASTSAAPPFRATLTAPTHTPKVNVHWRYAITVTDLKSKPIRARLTVQVVDPFGMAHPVEFGTSTRNIVNWPFVGVFRDFAVWPPESRGFRLTFRAIVKTAKGKVTLTYWVKSR